MNAPRGTALAGWGGRIRTSEWRNQNPRSPSDMSRHKPTEARKYKCFLDLMTKRSDIGCHDCDLW